jgi:hypothetical protein
MGDQVYLWMLLLSSCTTMACADRRTIGVHHTEGPRPGGNDYTVFQEHDPTAHRPWELNMRPS